MKTRGMGIRKSRPVTWARRKVQVVYMPRGNTMLQYCGS